MEMLKGILPRILPDDVYPEYKVFEGKQDLEKNLARVLKARLAPDSYFIVMRDQDAGDCKVIKDWLMELCGQAKRDGVLVRIACHELESFFLGDLIAVEQGLGLTGLQSQQLQKKFRNPDRLGNPAEELFKLTGGAYRKVAGSRAIAPHLSLEGNCSPSFNTLISGIRKLLEI